MKIFETFKESYVIYEGFVEVKFNSHKNHNPYADIVEGKLDKDTMITYGIYVKDSTKEIPAGTEFMELYVGENYVVGSSKRSNSRYYTVDKIPAKYKKLWLELKEMYETKYINEVVSEGKVKQSISDLEDLLDDRKTDLDDIEGTSVKVAKLLKVKDLETIQQTLMSYRDNVSTDELAIIILNKISEN